MSLPHLRIGYLLGEDVAAVAGDPRARALLSPEELGRAGRFRAPAAAHGFVAGRVLARTMLAGASGLAPGEVRLRTDPRGRPHIVSGEGRPGPAFSITHTKGLVGCAVSEAGDVGLDAEHIGRDADLERLARRFFAPDEVAFLDGLAGVARRRAFFAVWTLKEAFLKARGEGISVPLGSFSFDPSSSPPGFRCGPELDGDPSAWRFRAWPVDPDHVVSVALRGGGGDASAPSRLAASEILHAVARG